MEIWRVENEAGQGPYANSSKGSGLAFEDSMRDLDKNHDLLYTHPIARCRGEFSGGVGVYGFVDRLALDIWFDYFGPFGYDLLRKHGFSVHVYEVPSSDVEEHNRQVIFDKGSAHHVREEGFTEYVQR